MPATFSRVIRRPAGVVLALPLVLGTLVGLQVSSAAPAQAVGTRVSTASRPATVVAARALQIAPAYQGRPYRWGATGPRAFDCSGYTKYVFARAGKALPRTSRAQYAATRHLARSQARPGDLIFLKNRSGRVYHVGIYAGGGRYWHAPRTGDVVKLGKIYGTWYVGRI